MQDIDTSLGRAGSAPELQRRVLSLIAEGAPADDLLADLCRLVEEFLERGICTLLLLDPEAGTLSLRAGPSASFELSASLSGIVPGLVAGSCAAAAHTREVVVVEDTQLDPRWASLRQAAAELGIRSCWSTPILAPEGRVLGTFAISTAEVSRPAPHELELLGTAGHLAGIVLIGEETQRSLRRKEELLSGVLESMGDPLLVRDLEGRILLANSAALAGLAATEADVVGKQSHELFSCPAIVEQDDLTERQVIETRQGLEYEASCGSAEDRRHYHVRKSPLVVAAGKVEGVISILHDVTELKRREEVVRRMQKLESLGLLAGGVAHDFNNILTGVLGSAELALSDAPGDSQLARFLTEIHSGARRAADLTSQMLSYAGRTETARRVVSLPGLVDEVAALLTASLSQRAALSLEVEPGLPNIEADPDQVRQVVMNLLINASEALRGEPGTLTVALRRRRELEHAGLVLAPEPCADGLVELVVTDSGCGMQPVVLERIFDPFYSTKFTGRGLGLAAVRGIVRGHGGGLAVQTTPGEGTRFSVLWRATRREDLGADVRGDGADWQGRGRVLVVDDQPSVREVCRHALELSGFDVTVAGDGAEAVVRLRAEGDGLVAVLLDLSTPRMSAARAMREIDALRPGLPVLVISGFPESIAREELGSLQPAGFLKKPFGAAELTRALRRVLEASAAN